MRAEPQTRGLRVANPRVTEAEIANGHPGDGVLGVEAAEVRGRVRGTDDVDILEHDVAHGATLVVLKLAPSFSPPPGRGTIAALRAEFPNARPLPGFLILWR